MRTLFLILELVFSGNTLLSQNVLPKIAPVSPEAANLGKFGNLLKKEVYEWKNNGFNKIAETVNTYRNHYPFSKTIKEESKENL